MMNKYDPNNPVNQVVIPRKLVWSHPMHMLSTCFGAGCIGKGAGTFGTLIGALLFIVLSPAFSQTFWVILSILLFIVGALAAQKTSDALGVEDHGGIVVDEVAAIWLLYACIPAGSLWWIGGFIFFRIFDIAKLPPCDYIEKNMKNGWGIMLDDVVAAFYAWIVLQVLHWIFA